MSMIYESATNYTARFCRREEKLQYYLRFYHPNSVFFISGKLVELTDYPANGEAHYIIKIAVDRLYDGLQLI